VVSQVLKGLHETDYICHVQVLGQFAAEPTAAVVHHTLFVGSCIATDAQKRDARRVCEGLVVMCG
jgi:hypothetical protein